MAASRRQVLHTGRTPIKIVKWKIEAGSRISHGTGLLLYKKIGEDSDASELCKLKSECDGTVDVLIAQEGAVVNSGDPLLELALCRHPVVMKDLCAECGADLRQSGEAVPTQANMASVSMIHNVPELRVTQEQARKLGKADEERLRSLRKLVLLVDLDQTLIHTTSDDVPADLKDVHHFQLYGPQSPWYHTRVRPRTRAFLEEVSKLYELHICTFGARAYAHAIAALLDPDGSLFSYRILSRDECFNPNSKTGNLRALFPCGDSMVCIIDDREDVWNYAPNLVPVKPYLYFNKTGDINAPPCGCPEPRFFPTEEDIGEASKEPAPKNGGPDQEPKAAGGDAPATESEKALQDEAVPKEASDKAATPAEETAQADTVPEDGARKDKTGGPDSCAGTSSSALPEHSKGGTKLSEAKGSEPKKSAQIWPEEDCDDYLLYLEEILRTIHYAYYTMYDQYQQEAGHVPDLKHIVPYVRRKVLKGTHLVFSGVVPTTEPPETSRAWQVAKSLGALVSRDLGPGVTHLVAARYGTAKVNKARRMRGVRLVHPTWLWCCSERWEHVAEGLFPVTPPNQSPQNLSPGLAYELSEPSRPPAARKPTEQGSRLEKRAPLPVPAPSPVEKPRAELPPRLPVYDPVTGKRVWRNGERDGPSASPPQAPSHEASTRCPVERSAADSTSPTRGANSSSRVEPVERKHSQLVETTNPYLSMSSEQLQEMDQEVEDECSNDDEDDYDIEKANESLHTTQEAESSQGSTDGAMADKSDSESSAESLSGDQCPRGWNEKDRKRARDNATDDEGAPSSKFPRSELPEDSGQSDIEDSSCSGESVGSVDEELAAAVEREFLGL